MRTGQKDIREIEDLLRDRGFAQKQIDKALNLLFEKGRAKRRGRKEIQEDEYLDLMADYLVLGHAPSRHAAAQMVGEEFWKTNSDKAGNSMRAAQSRLYRKFGDQEAELMARARWRDPRPILDEYFQIIVERTKLKNVGLTAYADDRVFWARALISARNRERNGEKGSMLAYDLAKDAVSDLPFLKFLRA